MRINRRVAVGMTYLVLAGCGGGDKPNRIARPAPSAAVSDAPAAAGGGPCLQGPVRLESKDVPYVVANFRESFTGPVIEVGSNDYPNCKVATVRVTVAITADDLTALGRNWSLNFNRFGSAAVMNTLFSDQNNLRGSQIGSSCGSLVFAQGGPQFFGRDPPYDGTYGARGGRSFQEFIGKPAAGKYTLYPTDIQAPLTITCYAVEIEFQQD